MQPNLFDSARLLLDRAREHREEFSRRIEAWQNANAHSTVIEFDPDSGNYIRKERFSIPFPGFLFPVAADAFNNLRHTLDQAIFASALAKNPSVNPHGVAFAFGASEEDFRRHFRRTAETLPPEIVAIVTDLKPYKRENDRLWGLSNLTNMNKHRNLIDLGYEVKRIGIHPTSIWDNSTGWSRPIWDRSKNELILACCPYEDELHYKADLSFFVALGDVEIFKGQGVVSVLDYFLKVVDGILVSFEAETRRLFPAAF